MQIFVKIDEVSLKLMKVLPKAFDLSTFEWYDKCMMTGMSFFKTNVLYLMVFMLMSTQSTLASDPAIDSLMQKINHIKQRNNVSAVVVLVVDKNHVLINEKIGVSDWQNGEPLSNDHMFRIGSVSKSFAALLALRMQSAGIIDITKPISEYSSQLSVNNSYPNHKITIEQLLEHTAGLSDLSRQEWDYNAPKPISIEEALQQRKAPHKTQWQTGLHASYSNVGTGILGWALEKASDRSYEDLMDDYVFKPLSMQSSTLLLKEHVKKRLIKGYNTDGKTLIPYWHNIYRPFAAINTNDQDMIQFLQMLLNRGRINNHTFLPEKAVQRMENPQTTLAARSGLDYGYGLANYHWQYEGHTFHGHGGDADGYLSRYGYNKDSGLAYFVMINAFQHQTLKSMRNVLEGYIIKELPNPHYPLRLKLGDEVLKKYVGQYAAVTKRFGTLPSKPDAELKVFIDDQKLYRQFNGRRPQVLYAVSDNHFRHYDESTATVAFVLHQQKMYLQGDFGNFVKLD